MAGAGAGHRAGGRERGQMAVEADNQAVGVEAKQGPGGSAGEARGGARRGSAGRASREAPGQVLLVVPVSRPRQWSLPPDAPLPTPRRSFPPPAAPSLSRPDPEQPPPASPPALPCPPPCKPSPP